MAIRSTEISSHHPVHHPVAVLCETLQLSPIPVIALGSWPSGVRRLDRLGARLGVSLWLKEDGIAAAEFGGNKPRKLELLLCEARQQGCDSLVTVGAIGSNQVLATAIYGAREGFDTYAIVSPLAGGALPSERAARMTLHAAARGARLVPAELDELGDALDDLLEKLDDRAYVITAGGSTPLGNLAFVAAAFELARQIEAGALPPPDAIVVPLGTGGTAAGLAVGCKLAGLGCRIVGVRAAGRDVLEPATVARHVEALFTFLTKHGWVGTDRTAAPIDFIDDQLGASYGSSTPEANQAMALASELEGLELEATYSAKALAALIAHATEQAGRNVLFWQTSPSSLPSPEPTIDDSALPPKLREWLRPARVPSS